MIRCWLFFVVTLGAVGTLGCAAERTVDVEVDEKIELQDKSVARLIELFHDDRNANSRPHIIYALGELRASSAVGLLLSNLKCGQDDSKKRLPPYGPEPAGTALAKIGIPAVKPILKDLAKGVDEASMRILCNVLIDIYDARLARIVLQQEAEKATGKSAMNLKECVGIIDGYLEMQKSRRTTTDAASGEATVSRSPGVAAHGNGDAPDAENGPRGDAANGRKGKEQGLK